MEFIQLLESKARDMIDEASQALSSARLKHYEASQIEQNKERIARLFNLMQESVRDRNLIPMMEYARQVARERYRDGFTLQEVQTAFNVLEEAVWKRITAELSPSEYPEAFGLASTVLGAGKEALAVEYVSLASQKRGIESLDLSALFKVL